MLLKEFLDVNGIRQDRFAQKININKMTLNYILKRSRDIKLSTAVKIVEATNGAVAYKELLPQEKEIKEPHRPSQNADSSGKPNQKKKKQNAKDKIA